jgi:hypothetical protein
MFLLRQPTMVAARANLCAFVDAFRTAWHNKVSCSPSSSNLVIFRHASTEQRVAWARFFLYWLDMWRPDADLPCHCTIIGPYTSCSEQLACVTSTYSFVACTTQEANGPLSIVWLDDAPWPVTRRMFESAPHRKIWYVWGTSTPFSFDTLPFQLAPILAPTCPDAFLHTQPSLIALVDAQLPIVASASRSGQAVLLPNDLLCHVLQWTDYASGLTLGRVCHSWHRILKTSRAWKATRSIAASQSYRSLAQAMQILPDSLVSVGPSFDFVWRRKEMVMYSKPVLSDIFCSMLARSYSAWRGVTFDFTDWHRAYLVYGEQVAASADDSLGEHLDKWFFNTDNAPVERIHSMHLCGHTTYDEDWNYPRSIGWLSPRDMERALYFFPRITTLSLMIESLDTRSACDLLDSGESCMCLVATRLPSLTSLRIYSNRFYSDKCARIYGDGTLMIQDLHHLYKCTTLTSLSLAVPIHTCYNRDDLSALWPDLLASPLITRGNLRHLTLWRNATCCTTLDARIGVVQLPRSIQLANIAPDETHVDCTARLCHAT